MTGKIFKTYAVGAAVVGLSTLICFDAQAAVTYDTRALTDDAAPGTEPGVMFSSIGSFGINSSGQITFTALLSGPGVDLTNNLGMWTGASGSLGLTARSSNAAPGIAAGNTFSSFFSPVLRDAGHVGFVGTLSGPGVTLGSSRGIWAGAPGSLALVARTGDQAPGTGAGINFRSLGAPRLNSDGQVIFNGSLTGTSVNNLNDSGIWSGTPGAISLVARAGDPAPGVGTGVNYFEPGSPLVNHSGQIAIRSNLIGPGVDFTNNTGIWVGTADTLELVVREGDTAPGAGVGVLISGLDFSGFNNAGQVAFTSFLTGGDVQVANNTAVWVGASGLLEMAARAGDQAPGAEPGVVFGSFASLSPVKINGAGQVAFRGFLAGPGVNSANNFGVWTGVPGSLALVARAGDSAPGTEPGVVFAGDFPFNLFDQPLLNRAGQTVIGSFLEGSDVDSTNNRGIWATDTNGVLTLIARKGDLFDVSNDSFHQDIRTINQIRPLRTSGGEGGRPASFNDAGQFVFALGFTDGSEGIFVATIPEPGTLALFAAVIPWALRRRK